MKQRLEGEPRRLLMWAGLAAVLAAAVFGVGGRLTAPGATAPGAEGLNAQINDLNGKLQSWQRRADEIARQQSDAASQSQRLAGLKTDLDKQAAALKTRQDTVAAQQAELDRQTAALKSQQAALAAQQAAAANVAAPKPAALISQCDALAAYQFDPDRPRNSGWVAWAKDVSNPDARTVCEAALQTVGDDATLKRRLMLELGRAIAASGSGDPVAKWNEAGALGSSEAYNSLGDYYKARKNMEQAWSNYKQAAKLDNPSALNTVATALLFPDFTPNLAAGDPKSGVQYLDRALKADYYRAYYIAGLWYWDSNRPLATKSLSTSWCVKHDNDGPANADNFYFKKTGQHLSCQ